MKVVFRVDASVEMGTGHIMRCLTLANELLKKPAEICFICREHQGNLIEFVESRGFQVYKLPVQQKSNEQHFMEKNALYHAGWLGVTQQQDAKECLPILEWVKPDWLIIDHYGIDYRWQALLLSYYKKMMVIDDLADRKHNCDLLLDQTFGRQKEDYLSLVPESCQLLLGSSYALLRPEFSKWKSYSLNRRTTPDLKQLLITMGGADSDNVTGHILQHLLNCDLPLDVKIVVIMGQSSPHVDNIMQIAKRMPGKIDIKVGVENMAELMANSDLAIGAAGATTWERCCLGLPSIMLVLAENQEKIADNIGKEKIALVLRDINELCSNISIITAEDNLRAFSNKSSSIVDGNGVKRLVEFIK